MSPSPRALDIGARVEAFVREVVIPYEKDPRRDHHGAPLDELVYEMRGLAREAGVLTPHVLDDGQ
ncbi:MAG: acyl-CoA dehydrogenase, partial [Phenylobacterium zucineum]